MKQFYFKEANKMFFTLTLTALLFVFEEFCVHLLLQNLPDIETVMDILITW